jgi:hypothetical protein
LLDAFGLKESPNTPEDFSDQEAPEIHFIKNKKP